MRGTSLCRKTFKVPPPQKRWNELLYPQEWPLCTHEMSFLLPHFLKEGRGRIEAYFTRVFNPVWTYPDGFSWIEMLRDEEKVGLHAALDSDLERDGVVCRLRSADGLQFRASRPDEPGIVRRQVDRLSPAGECAFCANEAGEKFEYTYQANPGEVWEEDEFWINLSWAIDPDGSMGIRQYFESPYRPGQKLTVDEYYGWMFRKLSSGICPRPPRKKD